jgi:hypothetical protein
MYSVVYRGIPLLVVSTATDVPDVQVAANDGWSYRHPKLF